MSIENLSIQSLKKAVSIKERIEALNTELASILGGSGSGVPFRIKPAKKGMSAAGRAKVAAAQKKRWAKIKGAKPVGRKRKMSAAAKAKISAAAKLRWAKVKAAGKSRV